MPIYRYEVLDEDDQTVDVYEAEQGFADAPLKHHPITGERLRKVVNAPNLNLRYADWRGKIDPENLARHGFTRYEKDRVTGRYHKTNRGDGPDRIEAPQ